MILILPCMPGPFCCQINIILLPCMVAMVPQVAMILHIGVCPLVAMAPDLLQAYTSNKVSPSIDVWAFGIIATKVFLGRNLDKQRRDVRMHGL